MFKRFCIAIGIVVLIAILFLFIANIVSEKIDNKDCLVSLQNELTGQDKTQQILRETGGFPIGCDDFSNDPQVQSEENQIINWKNSSENPANYHAVDPTLFLNNQ